MMKFDKNKLEFIIKHNKFIQYIYKRTFSTIFYIIGLFIKTDENLVLFSSLGGLRYNDNPKTIYKFLKSNKKYKNLKYVWAFKDPEKFDLPAEKVKIDSFKYFTTALRAKYWITNISIERGLRFKKKNTRYLSTWHGTPLKLVGNAVNGRNDFDFSDVDVFCYASDYEKKIYIEDFKVKEESLILTGQPRNDELYHVNIERIASIRKKLGIPNDKDIILYTPTWRDSENNGKTYLIKPPIEINYWKEMLSHQYVMIFRMHQFTTKAIGLKFDDFAIDASNYPEINDLYIISDINISDYSATLIDFSILERPVFSFAYDYNEYKQKRGLYIDIKKELPIDVVDTQEELIDKILNINYIEECKKSKQLKNMFLKAGGNATFLCIDTLFKINNIHNG